MVEIVAEAFLSYAHADNDRENGRILRLAKLIENEFETLTGTGIAIFTDSAEIKWGQNFRSRLNEALQSTTFFIPVLTPTYFVREECQKEMRQFVSSARALGLTELLLSIRYIDVPDMVEGSPDELKDIAAQMQYEPWDDLRLEDEDSSTYRKAVNRLAKRLIELTKDLESKPTALPNPARNLGDDGDSPGGGLPIPDDDDDSPGPLDLIADVQPALEKWTDTVRALGPAQEEFSTVVTAATDKMNASNSAKNPFAARVLVARELARTAEAPLQEIERLSKEYSADLLRVDPGVRALLNSAGDVTDDPGTVLTFVNSLQGMVDQAHDAGMKISEAADAAREPARQSRDLRPIFRRYETAMRNIVGSNELVEEWRPLLDSVRASLPGSV